MSNFKSATSDILDLLQSRNERTESPLPQPPAPRLRQSWSRSIVNEARGAVYSAPAAQPASVPAVRSTAALRARAGEQFYPPVRYQLPEPTLTPAPQEPAAADANVTLRERVSGILNLFSGVTHEPEE